MSSVSRRRSRSSISFSNLFDIPPPPLTGGPALLPPLSDDDIGHVPPPLRGGWLGRISDRHQRHHPYVRRNTQRFLNLVELLLFHWLIGEVANRSTVGYGFQHAATSSLLPGLLVRSCY